MTHLPLTIHAVKRCRQRGLRENEVLLVLRLGEAVGHDAYVLTDRAAHEEIASLQRQIRAVERMRGVKVVAEGGAVITAYRPENKRMKRDLRSSRGRGS